MLRYLFFLLTVSLPFSLILGQEQEVSPKAASNFFEAGKYQEAKEVYKALLEKYSRNPQYNYYYGVTLSLTKEDYSEAIRRLRFAAMNGVSKDVYYYLGRTLQLTYEFSEAKKNYIQFKKVASFGDVRVDNVSKYILECDYGSQNSSRCYPLTVVDKDTVDKKKILSLYKPSKEVGNILRNSDFFQSGVDPNGIMYITERQDEAYFSLFSTTSKGQDLFKMVKLLDGWSDNDALPANVNSPSDEVYPFLASNGTTLYFASNRPGGFGGFDIYRTEFNIATKTYATPVNMGLPFNSPEDDFLFVSDDFNGTAWFASTRETTGNVVMVYKLKWDKSITPVSVGDITEVKSAAKLEVSAAALKEAQKKGDFTYQSAQAQARTAPKFKFFVNDTLTYTNFDQFKSPDALEYFKKGFDKVQKRDSLSSKMREKRSLFQSSSDEAVKDKMVSEILKMEKELYGYDDIIEESNFVARRLEIEKLRELQGGGAGGSQGGKISTPNTFNLSSDVVLKPEKYQFYSEEAFEKRAHMYAPMYEKVFDDMDINKLQQADSLYVWGSILSLESSNLMDKSAHSAQANELKFKKEVSKDEDTANSTEMLQAESKKLKEASLKFLMSSMDEKFAVYSLKLGEITPQINADRGQHFSDETAKANSYYREASGMYSSLDALEFSQIEKVISYKKMAVDTQDKLLFDYANAGKQGWTLTTGPTASANTAASAGVSGSSSRVASSGNVAQVSRTTNTSSVSVAPKEAVSVPMVKETPQEASASSLVYKIQIGVFKNVPSKELLSMLPEVTSEVVEGKEVVKYFSGRYATADEALSHIQAVKDAGFTGAYLVAYYNGKLIDLNKARVLEDK